MSALYDDSMSGELKVLTCAQNEFEAEMICGLLIEAGIRATQRLASGFSPAGRVGGGGARDVLVAAEDLDRARELLDESAQD
jgi:Putative prokaryotic signal transducing protein